ncbi:MAG: hypothetical protein ABIH71_03140 [Candidatus Omnitrophota bacterium]|nr:hypothetical protein [Candidatus Omnitrophota bacterium]
MSNKFSLTNSLTLNIETNKKNYFIDENLVITYIIQNISDRDIIFVNSNKGYSANWIKGYDNKENELTWLKKIIYELEIHLNRDKYIIIPKGQRYTLDIIGKITKADSDKIWPQYEDFEDTTSKVKKIETHNKLWIDFENSVIALNDVGKYTLKGVYESLDIWKEEGEKLYNLKNIWVGQINSNKVEITITDKSNGN